MIAVRALDFLLQTRLLACLVLGAVDVCLGCACLTGDSVRRACYQRRGEPALKRSGSDADRLAMEDLELSAAEGRVEVARDWADPKVMLHFCTPSIRTPGPWETS